MSDATKRGRPCLGFLARGERERTQGTCSTCDLPAAAHQRIIFYAVTLPPLLAARSAVDGGWEWPLARPDELWRPPTLVTVGLQRDTFATSAYLAFQEATGLRRGAVYLLRTFDLNTSATLHFHVSRVLDLWARQAFDRYKAGLAWQDLDIDALAEALGAARETLALEEKAQGRTSP